MVSKAGPARPRPRRARKSCARTIQQASYLHALQPWPSARARAVKAIGIAAQGPAGGGGCNAHAPVHIPPIPLELCDCHVGGREDGHILHQHCSAAGEGEGDAHPRGSHKHVPGLNAAAAAGKAVVQPPSGRGGRRAPPVAHWRHQLPRAKHGSRGESVVGGILRIQLRKGEGGGSQGHLQGVAAGCRHCAIHIGQGGVINGKVAQRGAPGASDVDAKAGCKDQGAGRGAANGNALGAADVKGGDIEEGAARREGKGGGARGNGSIQ